MEYPILVARPNNDGSLRADHPGLPETTRMVTYSLADQPTSVTGKMRQ